MQVTKYTSKGIYPGSQIQGRHHKSKTRVSVAPQKGLMSSNIKTRMHSRMQWPYRGEVSAWGVCPEGVLCLRGVHSPDPEADTPL